MKILHLSTTDIKGGAALAAYRLHQDLVNKGVDSHILVQHKFSDDIHVIQSRTVRQIFGKHVNFRILTEHFTQKLFQYTRKNKGYFSPQTWAPSGLTKEINDLNPDIIHIHWTQSGFLMPEDIPKIKAPIVWTSHDMWLFGNGEHCFDEKNLTRHEKGILWGRKAKAFDKRQNITFISVSKWMSRLMQQSTLLKNHSINTIHNGIPKNIFKPNSTDKDERKKLALAPDKQYILFGAQHPKQDKNKGYQYVERVIDAFKDNQNVIFLIFGGEKNQDNENTKSLGYLSPEELAQYYRASDVTLIASEQESFGMIAAESVMCGTPVVCFDIGGLKDIVIHKENGYRAKPFNHQDLVTGIQYCFNEDLKTKMQTQNYDFSVEKAVKEHVALYKKAQGK